MDRARSTEEGVVHKEQLHVLEGNIEPIGCLTAMAAGGCDVLSVHVHGDAVGRTRTVEERGTKKPEGIILHANEANIHVPDGNVGLTVKQTATKKRRGC